METIVYAEMIKKYKKLKSENPELFNELNDLRKKIRYMAQFNESTRNNIVVDLYERYSDLEDLAEILALSECETFCLLDFLNLNKENEEEVKL